MLPRIIRRRRRRRRTITLVFAALLAVGVPVVAQSAAPIPAGAIVLTGSATGGICSGEICTVDGKGQMLAQRTAPLGQLQEPSYSKNGKLVAFVVVNPGSAILATMTSTGLVKTLIDGWSEINHPTVSPDGKQIAFSGQKSDGGNLLLWVVQANGTGLRLIGDPENPPFASEPAWSPNGKQIAFVSVEGQAAGGTPNPSGIYIVNADGSNLHRLTPVSASTEQDPTWSPDGTWIAYSKLPPDWRTTHISSIYRMKADGTASKRLTSGFWDGGPVISPDDKYIAFYRYRGTTVDPHTYVISASGSAPRRLVPFEAAPYGWLATR